MAEILVFRILEPGKLASEREQHVACGTLTVLGNDDLCHAMQVATVIILIDMVVLGTVNEDDHIGILLDGSRLTKVAELGALALETFTTLHTTIQLTECQDGNI